jgi:hypothetical protein
VNKSDRNLLYRLQQVLEAVPFSASGTATSTGVGAIMFEQDMRALRPYIRKVLEGMVLEGNASLEEGVDYDNPEKLLTAIEQWIVKRKLEGWQNASEYSLNNFLGLLRELELL